jgi:SAM-dependent methyltransferase
MKIDYNLATPSWHDSHLYGPAPRWRRRILKNIIKKLDVKTCIEVGCAQPFLMLDLKAMGIRMTGCDISVPVIEDNIKTYTDMEFFVKDLCSDVEIPNLNMGGGGYDIVICSEVLEHLPDYQKAIKNMCKLSKKYILITVPSGKRYPIDENVGHIRHYEPDVIVKPLEDNGYKTIKVMKIGFPFHSLYKRLINIGGGTAISEKYSSNRYGKFEKFVSTFVYFLFSFNVFPFGSQLIILAQKKEIDI